MGNNLKPSESVVKYCVEGEIPLKNNANIQRKILGFSDTLKVWNSIDDQLLPEKICPICRKNMMVLYDRKSWEKSHIIAHSQGGSGEVDNLRPLCKECNRTMGKKHMLKYCEETLPSHILGEVILKLKLF